MTQVVNCRDGCGTYVEFSDNANLETAATELTAAGWGWLSSVSRWRCPGCIERLNTVTAALAADPDFADKLDPRSRGALPRNTASTILPPVNVAAKQANQLSWE